MMTKRVLIVGEDSFIGTSFRQHAYNRLDIETVSSFKDDWPEEIFEGVDTVLFCAAIVHRKQKKSMKPLYYQVNRDLPVAVALAAREAGVSQFVYFSTMSVYGVDSGEISRNTKPSPKPKDYYGSSKYEAEVLLSGLQSEKFRVAIIRPPMVYGQGCKGNYQRLEKLAKKTPFFPDIQNKRSMIFIDNLCVYIEALIMKGASGVFCPQDPEYVCTSEMVFIIAKLNGKNIRRLKAFSGLISTLSPHISVLRKLFCDLYYSAGDTENMVSWRKALTKGGK